MKKVLILFVLTLFGARVYGQTQAPGATPVQLNASTGVAATASVNSHTTAGVLTITVPSGQAAYITAVEISNCAGASAVTAAGPTFITTTGIVGTPQYMLGSGTTAGGCQPNPAGPMLAPLKGQASTNVVFTLPTFATNQTVALNVEYYLGLP